jgi:serine/threonine protein kinase
MNLQNYTIKSEIGHGGMSTVYLAHDNKFDTNVAVKVLNKEFVYNENIRKRFISEARNMYKMSHPNIIKVTDLIEEGDTVAFVMEYIEGETLKEYLERKGKLSDDEIKNLFSQMLEAVGYVHENNLVHRDIKPSNFMITSKGKIKLLDFGIAKNTDTQSSDYTQTGTTQNMGTPMYMSPEQIKSTKDVTLQSDIYSLGVVLWQMVMGKKPYDTNTSSTYELQNKIVTENLSFTNTKFDSIIEVATAKELNIRFNNCNELKSKLENLDEEVLYNTKSYSSEVSEKTIIDNSNDKTVVETQDNIIKNTTNQNVKNQNEQKVFENISSSEILINESPNKSLKLLTIIKIISFVIFLFIFYLISKNELEAKERIYIADNNFEYWQYYRLEFTRGASIVSFIFIGFALFWTVFFFKKLTNLGHKKWINTIRIIMSILMLAWSVLLFTTTGHISVNEVKVAWYIYIFIEILLDISTQIKIKSNYNKLT